MIRKFIGIILVLGLLGCKTQQIALPPKVISEYDYTEFCDLPNHSNQLVYTRAVYRGAQEYWAFIAGNMECTDIEAWVEWPEWREINKKFKKLIRQNHLKPRSRHFLLVDVVGRFEVADTVGFGHLNSYKNQFTVEKIINIQRLRKNYK